LITNMEKISIFWFRRDLRLADNAGLYHALRSGHPVLPIFIFDTEILDKLEDRADARVSFIHAAITELHQALGDLGSTLLVQCGSPFAVWEELLQRYAIQAVYTNRDYEPYALQRDQALQQRLAEAGVAFHAFKDQVIFDQDEVVKGDGKPYTVFTPYSKKWLTKLNSRLQPENGGLSYYLKPYPTERYFAHFLPCAASPLPTLADIGFTRTDIALPSAQVPRERVRRYEELRNFLAVDGTTRLGIHFRFGTVSIREKARNAQGLSTTFLNELIWRDFYSMILQHFPHVAAGPFRPDYAHIPWRNDPAHFAAWCEGRTGYPVVDAGMRELNATGHMHNRARMITASFLTKHLLIDWRWGEAYFASRLLDFDLASNNGGWQWAAGCGTDAAPYFRIFNPTAQQLKFDKGLAYIHRWVPEYGTPRYPAPIVDHAEARQSCLAAYKSGLKRGEDMP
jgi:deoxyribodipyrimidine photo-lyase